MYDKVNKDGAFPEMLEFANYLSEVRDEFTAKVAEKAQWNGSESMVEEFMVLT